MKQFVVGIMAFAAYWTGIDAFFYWLNRKAKRIITFHDVLPDAIFDKRANGVGCSESEFRRIVREIKKRFPISVDLGDVHSVTLAFDDGYLNQYEVVAKILNSVGGGVLFATGSLIDAPPENALRNTLISHWEQYVPIEILEREFGNGRTRKEYLKLCYDNVGGSTVLEYRENLLKHLDAIWPIEQMFAVLGHEYVRLRLTGITTMQIAELRKQGWLIGYHSKNHLPMSALSLSEMKEEMKPPEGFENIVFGFPYGELRAVDERAVRMAEELGYPCAVSNLPWHNRLTGRFFMPRMSLSGNNYRLHFQLSGLEQFIKTGRLLPVVETPKGK